MNIRPFDWRDLPVLYRYRHGGLYLDNAQLLTRGSMLIPAGALLSYFAPATGIFTYLCSTDEHTHDPFLGQVIHAAGSSFARLSYLAPEEALGATGLSALLDYLAREIGERGAFHVLAEVEESREAFEALRKAGFAIYARQRVWQLKGDPVDDQGTISWRACQDQDVPGVRSLYSNLVPGLVQQAEPLPQERLRGMVYCHGGEVLAYVELKYGPVGIWAQPIIHPDAEGFILRLVHLLLDLPNRRSRPVYVCVRSYQAWLESVIEEMGAEPGPRQAVMVRHLAVSRRETQPYALPAINGTRTEPTAPIARVNHFWVSRKFRRKRGSVGRK